MNQNKWKKLIGIFLILGVLVFSFWYGGDAPGLQGFSIDDVNDSAYTVGDGSEGKNADKVSDGNVSDAADNSEDTEKTVGKNAGNRNTTEASKKLSDSGKDKKTGFLSGIVMKIKKLSSSGSKNKKRNLQINKKAQKNANKAVDKSNKAKKKKSAVADNNAGSSSSNNNSEKNKKSNSSASSSNGGSTESKNAADEDENNSKAADNKSIDTNKNSKESDNKNDDTNSGKADSKSEDNNSNESTSETDDNAEIITCTIYISCASVLNYMDKLSDSTRKIIPEDGIILNLTEVKIKKGSTVFDVLQKAARDNKVHLEYNYTPAYKTYYIEGIGNLYQFDAGNLSGWMYSVNDAFPGVGCSGYKVSDGDSIKWVYTCSFGKDVGGYVSE
ncbi:MAG: DUF4430 domain-containing protein [Lachnospiraceae bacterium]|nr:DUF4430 domain-containing protein [Lachnospiraceae bacterium]